RPVWQTGGHHVAAEGHVQGHPGALAGGDEPAGGGRRDPLLLLIEGVGPRKSQALIDAILAQEANGLEALKEAAAKGSGPSVQGLQDLLRVLEEVSGGRMTPAEQMNAVCGYYLPILKQQYDDYPKRIKDVEHLYTIAPRSGKL